MDFKAFFKSWGVLAVSLIILFTVGLPAVGHAAESGEFSGTWVADGSREKFPFGEGREIYTFKLSGHVSLKTKIGQQKHYWSECVGLSDSVSGAITRCVWKDVNGPKIYITLKSKPLHSGGQVSGTIVGGTGPLQGISGNLSFIWSSFSFQKDGDKSMVMGQTLDLAGTYQLP